MYNILLVEYNGFKILDSYSVGTKCKIEHDINLISNM